MKDPTVANLSHHHPQKGSVPSSVKQSPFVSVVIPCYNEEKFILRVLKTLTSQYDSSRYEIFIVDGGSSDNTRDIVEDFVRNHPTLSVRLLANPKRDIPAALNIGIAAARGDIIVRMDAHSLPSHNYVRECVSELEAGEAAIVGMPWHIKPGADSHIGSAIALAVSSSFGAGDARYRLATNSRRFVDTVPFGAFKKRLWEELGGFNESLLTNEDYDFNYRARRSGGQIVLSPRAYTDYFARPTLWGLAGQYCRYGMWKARMLKLNPSSIKIRQIIPPLFVVTIVGLLALGVLSTAFWWLLLIVISFYLLTALFFASRIAVREKRLMLILSLPLVFLVIHVCWGASLIVGLFRPGRT